MRLARRRTPRRQTAVAAFVVLVLAGEVVGRWAVAHLPLAAHVPERRHGGADAWPAVLIVAKVGMALLLARLAWRVSRAHRVALGAERVLGAIGRRGSRPAPAIGLSPRAWLASFSAMVALYALPTSSGELTSGCCPLLEPWMHTQALPVFALLAVAVALLWRTVSGWLAAFERYANELQARAGRWLSSPIAGRWLAAILGSPRSRFGVSFESRPPPAPG